MRKPALFLRGRLSLYAVANEYSYEQFFFFSFANGGLRYATNKTLDFDRSRLLKVMKAAADEEFDVLLIKRLDRLGR
jgi:DNA invertase Pin-like site-specific DNA recombinase